LSPRSDTRHAKLRLYSIVTLLLGAFALLTEASPASAYAEAGGQAWCASSCAVMSNVCFPYAGSKCEVTQCIDIYGNHWWTHYIVCGGVE